MSVRENAMDALQALLEIVAAGSSAKVLERNSELSTRVPSYAAMVLRDGEPGEPEITIGAPAHYLWEHDCTVEILMQGHDAGSRQSMALALVDDIAAALLADPSLDGRLAHVRCKAPSLDHEAIDGGPGTITVTLPIMLQYTSTSPAG